MNTRHMRNRSVLGLAAALMAIGASAPAQAGPLPNSTAPGCLRPTDGATGTPAPGQTEGANTAGYTTHARFNGNGTKPRPGGVLNTNFQPITVSCPGATYTFTVTSADGTPLGWNTESTSPSATTSGSADGLSATITFTGDGATQAFYLSGTTSAAYDKQPNSESDQPVCVGLSLTASHGGVSYTWPESADSQKVCAPPAGSFYN